MSADPVISLSRRRFLAIGTAAGAALLVGSVAYQRLTRDPRALSARERRLIDALAVTLYPGNPGPPGDSVGVADYIETYFREGLEPATVRVLRGLLVGLEWGALFATGARFSSLSPESRAAFLRNVEQNGAPILRSALFGLKSIVNLAYFDHPAVREAVGIVRVCEVRG